MSAIGWRRVGWGQGARLRVTSHRFHLDITVESPAPQ